MGLSIQVEKDYSASTNLTEMVFQLTKLKSPPQARAIPWGTYQALVR
jgi:hypothetical protein